jgi:hypothetical protein
MNTNGRKVTFYQQLVQFNGTSHGSDKDTNLIEFQRIQQIIQFAILFIFLQLDIMLLETVKRQFGFVINVNFQRLFVVNVWNVETIPNVKGRDIRKRIHWAYILHKFLADRSDFLAQRGAEHHDLLVMGRRTKDFLYVPSHI